jgi:hypothetical protein
MSTKLKNAIIKHLTKKGNYDAEVDDYLIDILIENIEYAKQMQKLLEGGKIIINIPNGNGIITTKENPAYGTYVKCLTNIQQSAKQLGINRNDRIKLKLLEIKAMDDFDEEFN